MSSNRLFPIIYLFVHLYFILNDDFNSVCLICENMLNSLTCFSGSTNQKELKNIFSNDGSFLDQFKQMKDKSRIESKIKSFGNSKENGEKNYRYLIQTLRHDNVTKMSYFQ